MLRVLLLLHLVAPLLALSNTTLLGKWQNDRGLFLTINHAKNGLFSGIYETTKGKELRQYVVCGTYDISKAGKTLGWTVSWSSALYGSSHSTSAWSGKLYDHVTSDNGVPKIVATYIHTSDAKSEEEWESTVVGKSDFLYYEQQSKRV